jgi:hypothetical protein
VIKRLLFIKLEIYILEIYVSLNIDKYEIDFDKEKFFLRCILVKIYEKYELIDAEIFEVSRAVTESFEFGVVRNREIIKNQRFSM